MFLLQLRERKRLKSGGERRRIAGDEQNPEWKDFKRWMVSPARKISPCSRLCHFDRREKSWVVSTQDFSSQQPRRNDSQQGLQAQANLSFRPQGEILESLMSQRKISPRNSLVEMTVSRVFIRKPICHFDRREKSCFVSTKDFSSQQPRRNDRCPL